jgi:DNA-binding protein YbaB
MVTGPIDSDPLRRLREVLDSYPQRLAEATERVREIADQTVTGESRDGLVTVAATGAGVITEVRVGSGGQRGLDSQTLAEDVTEAANAALDAVDRLRADLTTEFSGAEHSMDEAEQMLTHRMNGLLADMDRMGRQLDDQLADIEHEMMRSEAE